MFDKNLTKMLEIREMSMRELARRSGVDAMTISRYCNNKRVPRLDIVTKLANVLFCTVDDLVNGFDEAELKYSDSMNEAIRLLSTMSKSGIDNVIEYINRLDFENFL